VALCEGPITGIGRIWADGKPLDMTGHHLALVSGKRGATADPFIAAKMGAANTPAYRGTAYVVFEELPLSTYGNRLPQLSFEVFRPLADPDTAEGLVKAVTMIPASGEFTYATEAVRKTVGATTTVFGQTTGGTTSAENLNALPDEADIVVALDRLQAMAPAVESVSLVVAWFGNDLRAGTARSSRAWRWRPRSPARRSGRSTAWRGRTPISSVAMPRIGRSMAARLRISRWCRRSAR
jgi:hypothetical protein